MTGYTNSLENQGEQKVLLCFKLSIHAFTHSLNKNRLTTYYTFKHHMLGITHLRPSQGNNLVYTPSFYSIFVFPHVQNHSPLMEYIRHEAEIGVCVYTTQALPSYASLTPDMADQSQHSRPLSLVTAVSSLSALHFRQPLLNHRWHHPKGILGAYSGWKKEPRFWSQTTANLKPCVRWIACACLLCQV